MVQNTFTETTTQSYGSRIMGSIKGVILWLLLFFWSFVLLYINEWSVDVSKIAEQSIETNDQIIDSQLEWQLISVTGKLHTLESIWDDFILKPWNYIALKRTVEMYSWKENTSTTTKENIGGTSTATKTYTYDMWWNENPEASENFKYKQDHINPIKEYQSLNYSVKGAGVWKYGVTLDSVELPWFTKLPLDKEKIDITKTLWIILANQEYLYKWAKGINNPEIGDMRIRYMVLKNDIDVTILWKSQNWNIVEYFEDDNNSLFRIFLGTRQDAIDTLRAEYKMKIWIFRLLGFVLMWVWLTLLFWPINTFLAIIPAVGWVSRFIIGVVTCIVALILSVVTIIISMIIHSVIALIITVVIVLLALIYYIRKKWDKTGLTQEINKDKEESVINNQRIIELNQWKDITINNETIQKNKPKDTNKKDWDSMVELDLD